MTISSTNTKNSYSGDGSTVAFSYTFKILDDDDITVILRTNATGTETVQTKTTHYSVSGVGNAGGGTITFVSAPAATETAVLLRNVPLTQTTDYTPNDPFPAATHEDALDKLTLMAQDTQEEVDRSIKLSRTNTMTSTEFTVGATDRANKVFAFDSSGELAVTQEIGTFQGDWAASTAYAERDLVKDTSTNNIFIVNSAHTSSGSQPLTTNTNSSKYDLIVDAAAATTSATNAASSATAAAASATAAAASESAAATSETNAAASEAGVAADAAAAAASASSASTSASNASTSETNASNSASAAATSATNAATSATSASNSASAASTSASNAATSESNASDSADAASTSASNAASSASSASTSETNAASSASAAASDASAAATSAAAAAASFDAFDDIYLGAKASAPTQDNDGDALTNGDLYFDTGDNELYIWNGSAWQAASPNIVADTTPQLGGDLDTNGNDINFGDNDKARFGNGPDLELFHDGFDSYINEVGVGSLYLDTANGANVNITAGAGAESMATFAANGAATLFHDNNARLATTTTGVDVTGLVKTSNAYQVWLGANVLGSTGGLTSIGANPIVIGTDGQERLRIDSSGNLLVGATAPQGDDASLFGPVLTVDSGSYDGLVEIAGNRSDGDNAGVAKMQFIQKANSATYKEVAEIAVETDGATANKRGGSLLFKTRADNSTDTPTRMTIDSSGRVRIGTSTAGWTDADDLTITNSSGNHAGMTILNTNTSNNSVIAFADGTTGDAAYRGAIEYLHGSDAMRFRTAATERLRIDSSGNLLVGKTTADNTTSGTTFYGVEGFSSVRISNPVAIFNRLTSDGDIVQFRKDGTTVGSIGTASSYIYMANGDTGIAPVGGTDRLLPVNGSGAVRDAAIDMGYSGGRFRDLYLSGGVYLGGTGSANHLDDYEEGTWTPNLKGTTGNPTISYSSQTGTYIKIGRMVTVWCRLTISSISGGSGTARIEGLTFIAENDESVRGNVGVLIDQTSSDNAETSMQITPNGYELDIVRDGGRSASHSAMPLSEVGAGTDIRFQYSYRTP